MLLLLLVYVQYASLNTCANEQKHPSHRIHRDRWMKRREDEGGEEEGSAGGEKREGAMAAHARPQIVLFGASMTQFSFELGGWGAALTHLYSRKADILLRGYSGWNTRRALEVVDKIFPKWHGYWRSLTIYCCTLALSYFLSFGVLIFLPPIDPPNDIILTKQERNRLIREEEAKEQPALVVVFFGANDAAFPLPSGLGQHVPLLEFEGNLCRIATHLQELSEKTRVVLTTAPPICEETRRVVARMKYGEKAGEFLDRTNERAGQYAAVCRAAAQKMGVGVVDLWTAIQRCPNWETQCLSDGMHLSAQGSKVMLDELLRVLKTAPWQPCLHWESLPDDFPENHQYDYVHPFCEEVAAARIPYSS